MFNKIQIAFFVVGISLMITAWIMGVNQSNWMAAVVLGGVGSSTFIVGTQHDR